MATGAGEEGRKKLTIAFIGAKGVGKTSIITVSRRHQNYICHGTRVLFRNAYAVINRNSKTLSGFQVVPQKGTPLIFK